MTRARAAAGGFTYLEVLLAAVLLAGTVTTMGYALAQSRDSADEQAIVATGRHLLQDGLAWLRLLPRSDRADSSHFGMETGESRLADVDDVDDLADLVETGPLDRHGTAADSDWSRSWSVTSASVASPATAAAKASTPLMNVRVTVSYRGRVVASETLLLARTP